MKLKSITLIVIFLSLITFVSAEINVLSNVQDAYNVNEKIALQTSVSYKEQISGYVKANINCNTKSMDYYVIPFDFKTTEQQIDIPELILTSDMLGKCSLSIFLVDLNNNLLDQNLVKLIEVSDKLNLDVFLDSYEFDPGETLKIRGTVKNIRDLDVTNSLLKMNIDTQNYEFTLDKANFEKEIPLDQKIKSGKHVINVNVDDYNGNKAEKTLEINVIPKPVDIDNVINKLEFLPGETIEISSFLYDQASELIENDAQIKIFDSKNSYITQGYGKVIYALPEDAVPGNWVVKTNGYGFSIESKFIVKELKKIDFSIEKGILYIKNTGNVNYKDSINVNANGEEITKDININPDGIDSIDLSKKLKPGIYDITVGSSAEEKLFPETNIPKSQDVLFLTGSTIKDVGSGLVSRPYLIVILAVMILTTLYLVSKNKKIQSTKREYEQQLGSVQLQRLRKEKDVRGFKPKKFAEMSDEEKKDYRKQILKNVKQEKKEDESLGYQYKPPKEGKGLFSMFD